MAMDWVPRLGERGCGCCSWATWDVRARDYARQRCIILGFPSSLGSHWSSGCIQKSSQSNLSSFTFPPPLLPLSLFFLFFSVESQSMTNRKKKGMQQVERRSQAESCAGVSASSREESSKKNSAPEVHLQAKVGQGSSLVLMRTPCYDAPSHLAQEAFCSLAQSIQSRKARPG